ncbi:hypothetical protein METBIDRAFT_118398 [Metschnikowia bicuspidata var. bicuspidata NRRL YB-4993]|uniref:Uncharacterized protein n=1 Tax=Metschnikowia bicuspidata var. bicuspidata NRRL YB-4993 TaxID=869754 RepID=A0A1A0HK02_9ASCO|nr:hypothetical protein METBIDRAFT_118398 [Metschnikowia bicuspidata var. bicuspidata NRRL YB-4993]OBA24138.1 hypothetical protein METBIDRAFT_118398 [Metschnikowia bicuspidata var. bicuspidata NRRL YB-4993]
MRIRSVDYGTEQTHLCNRNSPKLLNIGVGWEMQRAHSYITASYATPRLGVSRTINWRDKKIGVRIRFLFFFFFSSRVYKEPWCFRYTEMTAELTCLVSGVPKFGALFVSAMCEFVCWLLLFHLVGFRIGDGRRRAGDKTARI